MTDEALYNLATRYIETIEQMEKTTHPTLLNSLDEIRATLHNELLDAFHKRGMRFHHRDDITHWAYRVTGRSR